MTDNCPVKYHIIVMDLAGLELGANYYRHRARLGVGQTNGAKLAEAVPGQPEVACRLEVA